MMIQKKTAIGIYTDAAFSGIDVSILSTDGLDLFEKPISISRPYPEHIKQSLLELKTNDDLAMATGLKELENEITLYMIHTVKELLELAKEDYEKPELIGVSGQIIYHSQEQKVHISLVNADKIANTFGCPVVNHFIQSDLAAGGKGGPLLAPFYEVLTKALPKPLVVVALGGISAVTYIGHIGELMSFHIGPGNVLLDTWIQKRYGQDMDFDGSFGAKGKIDERLLKKLMEHPFLKMTPPKSAGRGEFNKLLAQVEGSKAEDGAATLTMFIAKAIAESRTFFPEKPALWILTGGGANNPTLVLDIKQVLSGEDVVSASEYGWDKNTLSAQGYAFLAVRSLFELPISFPQTTGTPSAVSGGQIHYPDSDE